MTLLHQRENLNTEALKRASFARFKASVFLRFMCMKNYTTRVFVILQHW